MLYPDLALGKPLTAVTSRAWSTWLAADSLQLPPALATPETRERDTRRERHPRVACILTRLESEDIPSHLVVEVAESSLASSSSRSLLGFSEGTNISCHNSSKFHCVLDQSWFS